MIRSGQPFGVRETHGILWHADNEIHASSDKLGWSSIYASEQTEHSYEAAFAGVRDHLIILHLGGPVGVSRTLGNQQARRVIPPGGLFILPGGMEFGVHLEGTLLSLHVYLRDSILREVGAEFVRGDPATLEILPKLGDQDPHLERLALSIRDVLADPVPAPAIYVDSLACSFAARLLHCHSARTTPTLLSRPPGGLTRRQIARAVDFMQAHLSTSMTLESIAQAVGLSQSSFARRFKVSFGEAPHRHLVALRLAHARTLLLETDLPVVQIAFDAGFSHQGHLTRFFKRAHGLTPAVYRNVGRT